MSLICESDGGGEAVAYLAQPEVEEDELVPLGGLWPFLRDRGLLKKHRKNCECSPGHYLIVNHKPSMS